MVSLMWLCDKFSKIYIYCASSNFQRGFHIHNYFTRFSHQYRSHPSRLKIKQLSINCLGPVLWNSLPEVIRKSPSMGSFKLSVKKFIIFDKYFVALPLPLGAHATFVRLSRASFMSHFLAPPPCRAGPFP